MSQTSFLLQILFSRTVALLLPAATSAADHTSPPVEFVVGGLCTYEGGDWDPKTSPLHSPFGIDFNREGVMAIVALEGGRVHKLSSNGELVHVSGDSQGNIYILERNGQALRAVETGNNRVPRMPQSD